MFSLLEVGQYGGGGFLTPMHKEQELDWVWDARGSRLGQRARGVGGGLDLVGGLWDWLAKETGSGTRDN